uniref:Uncharacterized protein n=1 Tax=Rhizophora mucronata TaxID=61149 RepID=A0A2P2PWR9_RHIMU
MAHGCCLEFKTKIINTPIPRQHAHVQSERALIAENDASKIDIS